MVIESKVCMTCLTKYPPETDTCPKDGASLIGQQYPGQVTGLDEAEEARQNGTLIGRYKIVEELNRNESTITYKVIDLIQKQEFQLTALIDQTPEAATEFRRAIKESALNPKAGELPLLNAGVSEDGRLFALYQLAP